MKMILKLSEEKIYPDHPTPYTPTTSLATRILHSPFLMSCYTDFDGSEFKLK